MTPADQARIDRLAVMMKEAITQLLEKDDRLVADIPPRDRQMVACQEARHLWMMSVMRARDSKAITPDEADALLHLDMLHSAPRAVAWRIYNNAREKAGRG